MSKSILACDSSVASNYAVSVACQACPYYRMIIHMLKNYSVIEISLVYCIHSLIIYYVKVMHRSQHQRETLAQQAAAP